MSVWLVWHHGMFVNYVAYDVYFSWPHAQAAFGSAKLCLVHATVTIW